MVHTMYYERLLQLVYLYGSDVIFKKDKNWMHTARQELHVDDYKDAHRQVILWCR